MRSSLISRTVLFILSFSFSVFIGRTAIHATSSHPFYWEKIDIDLQLVESGDLLVTETQAYVFTAPYTNQRTRYIQLDQIDEIKDITVTENNLPVANLRTSAADGKQYISWEHPPISKFPESHIFVLKYRVVGSLEVGNDRTQLKWMAIFPDRKAVVNSARIRLQMPVQLSGRIKDFQTNGVATTINYVNSITIDFSSKGSISPQSQLQILGGFSTTALDLKKSQPQSLFGNGWWILFVLLSISFWSGYFSSNKDSGDGGGDGGGGCGGDGGGGCGGGD